MARRLALAALTLSSALILFFCLVGGPIGEIAFAVLAFAFPALLIVVGAGDERGRLGSIAWPTGALLVVLEACLVGMLAFGGEIAEGPWLLGLPAATAVQLYGLILVPLAVIAVGYALTFDSFRVAEEDLERLRELAERQDQE